MSLSGGNGIRLLLHLHAVTDVLGQSQNGALIQVIVFEEICAVPFGLSVAEKYGIKGFENPIDMINDSEIDAVMCTTADPYHEEYVLASIAAGKYVFCEKPLAPKADACKRIVEAEMKAGKKLIQVGFMRRYDEGYKQLKAAVDSGKYGEALLLHCAHRNPSVPDDWDNSMAVENSMVHEIDVLRWLLGEDYATAEVRYGKSTNNGPKDLHDPQIMILTTKSGEEYKKSMYDCATLAGLLGVKKIVAMAGLPAGNETDTTPNWITSTVSWPDFMAPAYEYQWKVTIEFWNEFIAHCKKCGIEHIAIEEFPGTMVWSASTLLKLREATDPMLGINLDPSHMMILGADPIAAARALKGCIFHVHGKDARIERGLADTDGLLEPRPVTESADRVWNYVAVGCGKDLQWWKEFFSVCHMMGYDGDVSLEMEDLTMTVDAGVNTSIDALRQTISQ